ncbi:protein FAM161A isoform X2 [Diachasma alloeum]|uniref:protein FAM161A isoform X2 n=1 Tax=Diachasma alloeum TaxID=454923 RepID=UPI00073833A9|nr:protein FAM161A isoform X2 [Diachasma alloeum]
MEHRGSSFINSCVKVPVDPYSRQPTPSYERPTMDGVSKRTEEYKSRRINFASPSSHRDSNRTDPGSSDESNVESFIDFIESIPDYGQIHHLSNEQFRQKLDYLKRKQRLLLQNLTNCLGEDNRTINNGDKRRADDEKTLDSLGVEKFKCDEKWKNHENNELKLMGKKCHLEDSRTDSPVIFRCGNFAGLAEDQDLLTYRCKSEDKSMKTFRNREICSANAKSWSTWSDSKSSDSDKDYSENSIETRSLPPNSPRRWESKTSKFPVINSRDNNAKFISEVGLPPSDFLDDSNKIKGSSKKRRIRPIPLASRIPLYDKLLAAKEERSRMIREESAWSLMSQVKPFYLECDRRAIKSMSRSTPELPTGRTKSPKFKAKPVPNHLFGTQVYDRMLENEYFRQLQKKIRAAELMKSSSLPPSMARRERIKSAYVPRMRNCVNQESKRSEESFRMCSTTPLTSERSRSAMTDTSVRGNNLAAILRCQASREKLEREIQEKLEEQARAHAIRVRESMTARKPAWRALRHATRKEHTRDLDFRASLRRDESREQAERHRLEMELMLNRSFHAMRQLQSSRSYNLERRKKKRKSKSNISSNASSAADSRSDSGTLTNTSKSSDSIKSHRSHIICNSPMSKKKTERGPLRVSINETAELIGDDELSIS